MTRIAAIIKPYKREVAVADAMVDACVDAIASAPRAGKIGDGKFSAKMSLA